MCSECRVGQTEGDHQEDEGADGWEGRYQAVSRIDVSWVDPKDQWQPSQSAITS